MPATIQTSKKQQSMLERFVGTEARIGGSQLLKINNHIEAEWHEVNIDNVAEDRGMLYLFPIDDHKYCLQLYFLQSNSDDAGRATVSGLRFHPAFFDQYPPEVLIQNQPFRFDQTTEQQFSVCTKTRALLGQLQEAGNATAFIRSLRHSETAMQLLRCTLECISTPFTMCQVPACRFLAFESEREKIMEARHIVDSHADHPFTIRELSRKVGINECYLKKGFKALTGKTIHDYQQNARINKARELLQQQGRSVTEVAATLGFSSISHFSTAFKRVTGLKPCELLK